MNKIRQPLVKLFNRLSMLLVLGSFQSALQAQCAINNLVSYWKMEEAGGLVANDSKGTNHGQISGATWTSGQVGGALSFDGSDWVDCGGDSSLHVERGDFTVEAWVRPSSLIGTTVLSNQQIGDQNAGFVLQLDKGRAEFCVTNLVWGLGVAYSAPLIAGSWYHVAGVYRDSILEIYINGAQGTGVGKAIEAPVSSMNFYIGSLPSLQRKFQGMIDEVAIYSRALSPVEIIQHHKDGLNGLGYGATPIPPIAEAGADKSDMPVGSVVMLDGSASHDPVRDSIAYTWELIQKPQGSSATLSAPNSATPTFTADVAGEYTATLLVTNCRASSEPDTVHIRTEMVTADLQVEMSGPQQSTAGQWQTYTITVSNFGPAIAQAVYVADSLPELVDSTGYTGAYAMTRQGRALVFDVGDLSAGQVVQIEFAARIANTAPLDETLTNTATVSSATQDANPQNNLATVSTVVVPGYRFEAWLEPAAVTGEIGAACYLTVKVRNTGTLADQYTLSWNEQPPAWIALVTGGLALGPGEIGEVRLRAYTTNCIDQGTFPVRLAVTSAQAGTQNDLEGTITLQSNPIVTGLVPADEAISGSTDVLFGWTTGAPSSSSVYYRRTSDTEFTMKADTGGENTVHRLVVEGLERNTTYEWYVRSASVCGIATSGIRTLTIGNGIVFTQRQYYFSIDRDYAQLRTVGVRNDDNVPHTLRLSLDVPTQDLAAGFLGEGGDSTITLAPGETRNITLAIHAQDAVPNGEYDLMANLVADQDSAKPITDHAGIHVSVPVPAVDFTIQEISHDPKSMMHLLRITNRGVTLTDLSISHRVLSGTGSLLMYPMFDHAYLPTGGYRDVWVYPLFDETFQGMIAEVTASAAGKDTSITLNIHCDVNGVPTKGRATNVLLRAHSADWYCTNKPSISMNLRFPPGVRRANVYKAELRISISPPQNEYLRSVRPHTGRFYLNGHLVGGFDDIVPHGVFVVPVDPAYLNEAASGLSTNVLTIRTSHLSGGHYVQNTGNVLSVCLTEYNEWVCAENQDQADSIVTNRAYVARVPSSINVQIIAPQPQSHVSWSAGVIVQARITDDINGVSRSPVVAALDNGAVSAMLFDDGQHYDGLAGDGVFGNLLFPLRKGTMLLRVSAKSCDVEGSDSILLAVDNDPPTANAGTDQTVQAGPGCQTQVSLDGSGSVDPNHDPLTYTWSGDFGTATGMRPVVVLGMGSHVLTLTIDDGNGGVASDQVQITVRDGTGPVPETAVLPEIRQTCLVNLPQPPAALDNCAGRIVGATSAPAVFTDYGSHIVMWTFDDGNGNVTTQNQVIVVENPLPVFDQMDDIAVDAGNVADLRVRATDACGDEIVLSAIDLPVGAQFADEGAGTGHFHWQTARGDSGTYQVTFFADDGYASGSYVRQITVRFVNNAPKAITGDDQTVHAGLIVLLDGSGSYDVDGDYPLQYDWRLVAAPPGSQSSLSEATESDPILNTDLPGDYLVELVVTDALGLEGTPDTIKISTVNSAPVADAGPDQSISTIGQLVLLDGSGSYDNDGDVLTYWWEIAERPSGSTAALSDPRAQNPRFEADLHGDFVCVLTVGDAWEDSRPDTVLLSFANVPPVAVPGGNQAVLVGDTVLLDGSGSYDANGDAITFAWTMNAKPAGSAAEPATASAMATIFVADLAGEYTVSLVVGDGFASSTPAVVNVLAVTAADSATSALIWIVDTVNALPDSVFNNAHNRDALTININMVTKQMQKGNYGGALKLLQNVVMNKVDGCVTAGVPDKNDWLLDCAAQTAVYGWLLEMAELIRQAIAEQ